MYYSRPDQASAQNGIIVFFSRFCVFEGSSGLLRSAVLRTVGHRSMGLI